MSRLSRWLRSRRMPPRTPYEHLLFVPRYEVRTEELLGTAFRIPDGAAFYANYIEIFQDEIYRFESTRTAPRIVDCGANCGATVVYFQHLFPDARIVAVEADPAIFSLLEWNVSLRRLCGVTLINKAVTVGTGPVLFHCEGADAGRIHALGEAKSQVAVPAVSLDELLAEPVDFLKVDIEGAEVDSLCSSRRLDAVDQMMVEYHSFADAPQGLHELLAKIAASGFRYYVQTQFCAPRPLVEPDSHLGMDLQLNIFATRRGIAATGRNATRGAA
jgi:FkbM family methyltransferase